MKWFRFKHEAASLSHRCSHRQCTTSLRGGCWRGLPELALNFKGLTVMGGTHVFMHNLAFTGASRYDIEKQLSEGKAHAARVTHQRRVLASHARHYGRENVQRRLSIKQSRPPPDAAPACPNPARVRPDLSSNGSDPDVSDVLRTDSVHEKPFQKLTLARGISNFISPPAGVPWDHFYSTLEFCKDSPLSNDCKTDWLERYLPCKR